MGNDTINKHTFIKIRTGKKEEKRTLRALLYSSRANKTQIVNKHIHLGRQPVGTKAQKQIDIRDEAAAQVHTQSIDKHVQRGLITRAQIGRHKQSQRTRKG